MGDLVGSAVDGELYFIARLNSIACAASMRRGTTLSALFADMARLNALYMIATAGSGHIGSSFSSMDLFAHLQLAEIDSAAGRPFLLLQGTRCARSLRNHDGRRSAR